MTFPLGYHRVVNRLSRRSIPASLALFATFPLALFVVSGSFAQANGSSGFAHSASVAPPTAARVAPPTAFSAPPSTGATSVHNGFGPANANLNHRLPHSPGNSPIRNTGQHPSHHIANGTAYYPYVYAVPVPYAVDVSDADTPGDEDDAEYQGGPTVFDRRGSGPDSYVPPTSTGSEEAAQADPDPEPPQPPTTLVFKDGHQLEVNNYAIVSQTLYDLTPGHPRKIALADLDLPATQKQNDDHGVVFQLPPSAQAN
ncbi:MAG: hypothetical protein WB762_18995 [Candidatus Sulfotelmatobacter sp.]